MNWTVHTRCELFILTRIVVLKKDYNYGKVYIPGVYFSTQKYNKINVLLIMLKSQHTVIYL